jgi:hypothetical protein
MTADLHRALALATVTLAASAWAAPQDAEDDFERATLGLNWTLYGGSAGEIVNGSDLGIPDPGGWIYAGWTQVGFPANAFSQAKLADQKPPEALVEVFVRRRASDGARYGFGYNGDPGKSQWELKYHGVAVAQARFLAVIGGPAPANGSELRLEARGINPVELRGYLDGALVLVATDGHTDRIASAGPMGVAARAKGGSTLVANAPIFAHWWGGSAPTLDPNDAGLSWDGGWEVDAGADPEDGGVDAGSGAQDAGAEPQDAGLDLDGGAQPDAGAGVADAGAGNEPPVDDGSPEEPNCGCHASGAAPWALFALVAIGLSWRRRRAARRGHS